MSDRDDSPLPMPLPPTPEWTLILDACRRTAKAVADLALLLQSSEKEARRRHEEIMSEAISLGAEVRLDRQHGNGHAPRHLTNEGTHGEDSTKIVLPGGEKFEISAKTAATLWKVTKIAFALLAAGGGWIIHLIYEVKTLGK